MKKLFSTKWKASSQPRKQRKYLYRAPKHVQSKFLNAPLSKDMAKKHGLAKARIIVGDKVKVMAGRFKGKEGKVELIDLKKSKSAISGIEVAKKDGSKSKPLIHASNLLIIDAKADDKKRFKKKQPQASKIKIKQE
ncbi:50S ribosomal protein L24 [Candidatus Woesearchaeota archaeon]|nr:50S ribosomal protein L24 [Candidatus Woesearchaeota archaeon]